MRSLQTKIQKFVVVLAFLFVFVGPIGGIGPSIQGDCPTSGLSNGGGGC